jgi:hypothetical protein
MKARMVANIALAQSASGTDGRSKEAVESVCRAIAAVPAAQISTPSDSKGPSPCKYLCMLLWISRRS